MEINKTQREKILFWIFLGTLIIFSGIEWLIIRTVSALDSSTSVLFFVVLNINVIIAVVFIFLSIRHLLRFFFSRHGRLFGKSLKTKLSIMFPALSIFPTLLIFLVSFFYIHASFDQWFKLQVVESVGDAVDLTTYYYDTTKKVLQKELAHVMQSRDVVSAEGCQQLPAHLDPLQWLVVVAAQGEVRCKAWGPEVEKQNLDVSKLISLLQNSPGNVLRYDESEFIYTQSPLNSGEIAYLGIGIPKEYSNKMAKVAFLAQDLKELNPYAHPLKSIYTIALIAMTALIIFSSLWIGIHLADRLSKPLLELTQTMGRVKEGDLKKIPLYPNEQMEMKVVKESYNQMIENWENTKLQLEAALSNVQEINHDIDIQNKFVELVLDDLDSAIVLLDSGRRVVLHNRVFGDRFGNSKKLTQVQELPASFQRLFLEFQKKTERKKHSLSFRDLREFTFKDGTRTYEILMRTLVFRGGANILYLIILHDFTDIQAEQALKAWQEVVKRVAHEIKNPLTPVQLMNERLIRKLNKGETLKPEDLKDTFENTLHHVQVIKSLVAEFSKVANLPTVSPSLGTVTVLMDRIREVSMPVCGEKSVELELEVDNNIPPFPYDFNALLKVFQNLIQNAIQAFEMSPCKHARILLSVKYNRKLKLVVFMVDDNGPGISLGDQNQIFRPHFTTKEKGMGLGLSISKKLVEDHGGRIQVFSGGSQIGTRFVVELPVYRFAQKADIVEEQSGVSMI